MLTANVISSSFHLFVLFVYKQPFFSWLIFFQYDATEPEIDIGKNSHCDRAERFKDLGMFVPQKKCVPCQTFSRNAEIMRHIAYPK